jgi:hypothetical protein
VIEKSIEPSPGGQEAVAYVAVKLIGLAVSWHVKRNHVAMSWKCLLMRLLSRVGRELLIRVIPSDHAHCKPLFRHRVLNHSDRCDHFAGAGFVFARAFRFTAYGCSAAILFGRRPQ